MIVGKTLTPREVAKCVSHRLRLPLRPSLSLLQHAPHTARITMTYRCRVRLVWRQEKGLPVGCLGVDE